MSMFGDMFGAAPVRKLLDVHSDAVSYKKVDGTVVTVNAIYNEFVAAIDDFGNAIFTIASDPTLGLAEPERGDELTFAGEQWTVIDIRNDEAGMIELRCMRPIAIS